MKRLIDIDRFLRTLNSVAHVSGLETMSKVAETMAFMIEAQWSLFPEEIMEPEWIPVSERLPEDDDYKPFSYYEDGAVLFCTKNGKVGFGWYYESTKEWANEDDHTPGEVIAWMPLPEPYKEDERK